MPMSPSNFLSHSASLTASAKAMYSAAVEETAVVGCSLLLQLIAPLFVMKVQVWTF